MLVTDVNAKTIGEVTQAQDRPMTAVWTIEYAGDGQTHDPIMVYKVASTGQVPTGVLPLTEWDGSAPLNYTAGNAYWVRDGVKRIQYYRTENLNNL
jgi:hypothetical protein